MWTLVKRLALAALVVLGLTVPQAQAQTRIIRTSATLPNPNTWVAPYTTLNQYAYNVRTIGRAYQNVPPWMYGYNPYTPNTYYTCYGYCPGGGPLYNYSGGYGYTGYGYYGGYPYPSYDTAGDYLNGAASVINSQSQFMKGYTEANLLNEKVRQEKIDTQRKIFDERLYEKANTPTQEDIRARQRQEALRRALNDPPLTEILSGDALDVLLKNAQDLQAKGLRGPNVPLDANTLRQINVSSAGNGGNIGLLKAGGKLDWPIALQATDYDTERKQIDKLLPEAIKSAMSGPVDAGTLRQMTADVTALKEKLRKNIGDLSPDDSIQSNRYLNQLNDGLRALQQPNAGKELEQKWIAQGKSVGELVQYMAQHGLQFDAATAGDEAAYQALHYALATYATGLAQYAQK